MASNIVTKDLSNGIKSNSTSMGLNNGLSGGLNNSSTPLGLLNGFTTGSNMGLGNTGLNNTLSAGLNSIHNSTSLISNSIIGTDLVNRSNLTNGLTNYRHWKYRNPPEGLLEYQLMKCIMPQQPCVFKDSCPNAHSDGELEEWKARLRLESIVDGYVDEPTYPIHHHRNLVNEKLNALEEGENEVHIVSELIGSHSVIADENLFIMHVDKDKELAWMFTVTCLKIPPSKVLERVYLMNESKEFSIAYVFYSECDNIKPLRLPENCHLWENGHKSKKLSVLRILLRFYSSKYGIYHQEVIFDFGGFPKLVRKMGVQVANEEFLSQAMKYDPQKYDNDELTWMEKHEIREFDGRINPPGLENIQYALPPNIENLVMFGAFKHLDTKLSKQNYRFRLHTLLYIEEYQRRADLQSISLHLDDFRCCLDKFDIEKSTKETATILLDDYILEHFARLVGRSGNALVRLNTYEKDSCVITDPLIYQVVVQGMKNDSLIFELNSEFSSLLRSSTIPVDVDICFCLVDIFQLLHKAIENVDLALTFPDLVLHKNLPVPVKKNKDDHSSLSKDQLKAINVVMDPTVMAPVLLLGPFGAGKTRTIATLIQNLIDDNKERSKRILICTHSNSAADHYIQEYFHPLHKKSCTDPKNVDPWMLPLRINWEYRFVESVSDRVLSYCLLDNTTGMFKNATKEDLDKHSLIVSTLMTSGDFYKLGLPPDYFSHVFIDEAAQAMEVEALVPLLLATKKTKILLAGDHMQMYTPLSSSVAKSLGLGKSLLERLFEYYPFDAECKLKLLENFRSYKEIVDLSSHLFYEDSLLSNKLKPDSEKYPIEFHGVDGLESLSKDNPSYENFAEATEVMIRLAGLQLFWDSRDVTFDMSTVCVVSFYPAQVRRIRKVLRRNEMGAIRVESVNNIQGLEFDTLIISTVRTACDGTLYDEHCGKDMGFLTNPKLLNTALTRARYQVIIVGDPLALCSIGECKACWKTIIKFCDANKTFDYRMPYAKLLDTLYEESNNSPNKKSNSNEVCRFNNNKRSNSSNITPMTVTGGHSAMSEATSSIQSSIGHPPRSPPPQYDSIVSMNNIFPASTSIDNHVTSCDVTSSNASPIPPMIRPPAPHMPFLGMNSQWPLITPSPVGLVGGGPQNETQFKSCNIPPHLQPSLPGLHNMRAPFPPPGIPPAPGVFPNMNQGHNGQATPPCVFSKVFLPPCKTLFDLRQKINFVQSYCLHLLVKINANSDLKDLVRNSGSNSLQKLDELSRNYELCQPSDLGANVINIECEVERCYLFAEGQFNGFVNAHFDTLNGFYPDRVSMDSFSKLRKQLYEVEVFLKNEHFKPETGCDRQTARLKKDLYALSCHSLLISYELQVCQWLLAGSLAPLLNVKLEFIEQSIRGLEAGTEQFRVALGETTSSSKRLSNDYHHNQSTLSNTSSHSNSSNHNNNGTHCIQTKESALTRNMASLSMNDTDPDVVEWFSKRKNDPYVQEYVTTNVRHFAERLPSPLPMLQQQQEAPLSTHPPGLPPSDPSVLFTQGKIVDMEYPADYDYDYSMKPPYDKHVEASKARNFLNVYEGKITYDYTENFDQIHGKVLVSNMLQVHVNGLRRNNRALPEDTVVVQVKKSCDSITFDTPGEVICVSKRSPEILTCRRINNSLVIPVMKHGPPILLVRGVGVERRQLDSNTLYKVKIVDWPNEMKYPIGNIVNMCSEVDVPSSS